MNEVFFSFIYQMNRLRKSISCISEKEEKLNQRMELKNKKKNSEREGKSEKLMNKCWTCIKKENIKRRGKTSSDKENGKTEKER